MITKLLNLKAILTAVLFSTTVLLFIGCFANPPANMDDSFSGKYWFYLNRGYPQAWAGLALAN